MLAGIKLKNKTIGLALSRGVDGDTGRERSESDSASYSCTTFRFGFSNMSDQLRDTSRCSAKCSAHQRFPLVDI